MVANVLGHPVHGTKLEINLHGCGMKIMGKEKIVFGENHKFIWTMGPWAFWARAQAATAHRPPVKSPLVGLL